MSVNRSFSSQFIHPIIENDLNEYIMISKMSLHSPEDVSKLATDISLVGRSEETLHTKVFVGRNQVEGYE